MRTLTARITWQFAALFTLSTALVLSTGGWLLDRQMLHGVQQMHEAEFVELKSLLKSDASLSTEEITRRIEHESDSDIVLFFIQIDDARGHPVYRSDRLGDVVMPPAQAGRSHWTTTLPQTGPVRISEYESGPWRIRIASPLKQLRRQLRDYARFSGFLTLVFGVVSVGLGYGFSRVTLRPVRLIEQTARRLGADNLRERIVVPESGDELSALARLLNQMLDRLEQSFEQVRRFTADASHELKTPLALIRLNAEKLRPRLAHDAESTALTADLLEEIARMHRIIESLLFLAKADSGMIAPELAPHDMRAWIVPFVEDARVLTEDRGARFQLTQNDAGTARFESQLLRQLLLNLVSNAINVSPDGGLVTLESAKTESGWRFVVADEGPGLPPDQLERIFERFVRFNQSNGESSGHGLGLAICRGIVDVHGGRIRAVNRTDGHRGLRIEVELPA